MDLLGGRYRIAAPLETGPIGLADRAAPGLARLRARPVLTSDRAWRSLHLSIRIEVIR